MVNIWELGEIFLNNIAPVLIIAGIGLFVGWRMEINHRALGQIIFNIFSPALTFYALYTSEIVGEEMIALVTATVSFQIAMLVLAFAVVRVTKIERRDAAAFMLSAFCVNAGNFGLSLSSFAFGPEVLARAVIIFITTTVGNYSLGVVVASSGHRGMREAIISVGRVPAIYAAALAFILKAAEIELPLVLDRSVGLLSEAAIPSLLVLLGLQLSQSLRVIKVPLVAGGVGLKLFIAPFVALGLASLIQIPEPGYTAFILQASMPTAVLTLLLASEYELDNRLSLSLIMATTLVSPITLSLVIALLK
jgi:malate permease and related proteins